MSTNETPRTDAEIEDARNVALEFDCKNPRPKSGENIYVVPAAFARQLERELNEAKEKLEVMGSAEKCIQCSRFYSPSLIESGWCIFCIQRETIKERDAAKARAQAWEDVADELVSAMQDERNYRPWAWQKWRDSIAKFEAMKGSGK